MNQTTVCRVMAALAALSVIGADVRAHASEQAQMVMMRAAAELHRGMREESAGNVASAAPHYQQALDLLNQAATDTEDNANLLYLKGVTKGRLQQWDEAVQDLKEALERDAGLIQAQLEIGVSLVKRGERDEEAAVWLAQAIQQPSLEAAASFYFGIVELRRRNLDRARTLFARVVELDPSMASVCRYYQGVVELEANRRGPATELLQATVADVDAGSGIRAEARKILNGLARGDWPKGQRYRVYGTVGLEYDSNVLLAPVEDQVGDGFDKEADGRAVIAAGGHVNFWRNEIIQLGGGYDFLQSLHFDLTQFDIQSHRPSLFLNGRHGLGSAGLIVAYDYYLRDLNSFLGEAEVLPWASIDERDWGRADLFYRFRMRDFKDLSLRHALDSYTHTVGIDQFFYLPTADRYVAAGYRFEYLDARPGTEDNFMYQGNQVWGGVGWSWPFDITTELDVSYRFKNYLAGGRDDNEYRLVAAGALPITQYLNATLAYYGTFNDSNIEVYEYHRHIVSLSVGVTF